MTFKTGKQNPWYQKDAEIKRLKAQIDEMHSLAHRRKFAAELGESIMIMLSVLPMDQWPDLAKTAFRHHAELTPAAAWDYKDWHDRANLSRRQGAKNG